MARAMKLALAGAGRENAMAPGDIGYLMPAGLGGVASDASEANAIRDVFGGELENGLAVGIPRSQYGNPLGASGALDCAVACASMDKGTMPTSTGCASPEDGWSWANCGAASVNKSLDCVMVNSMGRGGVNVSVVLKKVQ
jgi:3-oxoacyl-(acyl-carrier-protein) synthase